MQRKNFPPDRMCTTCLRPFSWRKKWEDCWNEVKYCSERCRKAKTNAT
ncbi:DUF2256 domain-containing protein [Flavobacteriales bacterium]|nr:DUF2256 domain-containing protein [Flavobacteriales bacterium]